MHVLWIAIARAMLVGSATPGLFAYIGCERQPDVSICPELISVDVHNPLTGNPLPLLLCCLDAGPYVPNAHATEKYAHVRTESIGVAEISSVCKAIIVLPRTNQAWCQAPSARRAPPRFWRGAATPPPP